MIKNYLHCLFFLGCAALFGPETLNAAQPRLFPDLVLRYIVGDTNAENPIQDTEGPKSLAAADLNHDGRADLITGNLDGSVSVLLATPDGRMQNQILHPAAGLLESNSLRAVVTADFNRDGHPDVAVADIAHQGVVVLLGTGSGILVPSWRTNIGPARALAAGDFNNDGKADLLVGCSPPNGDWGQLYSTQSLADRFLCVLPGNGDGTFQAPQYLVSPGARVCFYDVEATDINQDGRLDVLALDFSRWNTGSNSIIYHKDILIFTNRSNGTFTTDLPQRVLRVAGEGPRAMALAYLDERLTGGGTPPPGATLDLVVANRDSATLDLFFNLGGLNFAPPKPIIVGDLPRDVATGDLDRDGNTDLVVVDRDEDTIAVLPGLGGGAFHPPNWVFPTGVSPRQVVLADFNGDGTLDAAVNNRISEDVSIFHGNPGTPGFLLPDGFYPAGYTPVSLVTEDFNGDTFPDVATVNLRSHDVRVRLNAGDGTLGSETIYAVDYEPAFIAAADLNGDGHLDLVVSCLGSGPLGSVVTLLGRANGTFEPPVTAPPGPGIGVFKPYWLRLGDLSGDGRPDAAVSGLNGSLVLFRGRGDGTFEPGVISCLPGDGRPLGLALGDFNQDRQLDIATSRGKLFLNNGHFFDYTNGWPGGAWPGPITLFTAGTQAWATEAEDLDGDGFLDLLIALTFVRPDPIGVLYGKGDGSFTEPTIYAGPDVGAVALLGADMDGDGVKDIVIGNRCAATVMILRGIGNRLFELREIIRSYSVEDIAVADLNRDGKLDIVGVGNGLWTILNGSTAMFSAPRAEQIGTAPARAGLYINELMSLNQDFLIVNGTTPDWIEIYNHNLATQSLAGWSLRQYTADGDTNRWSFSAANSIPPEGYLVAYCKKKAATNTQIYASFELSSDGENLALVGPDGAEVDRVLFPPMPRDVSYARIFDGARFFCLNPAPTLGSRNTRPANLQPSVDRKDPYVGPGGSSLGLTARFFDDVAIAYAAVCYRVAGSSRFSELLLNDDGRNGDKQPGDGYYGALLPTLPSGATVEYYLRVVDLEGQVDQSPGDPNDASQLHRVTVPRPGPALRLSELVADNQTGPPDERGQFEDWLEVANVGTAPVSLDGFALTKDYFNRAGAWHFPSNRWLNPGERVLVFCDDDAVDGPLHANFKLLRDGDRVFLVQTDELWTIVDCLSYGPLPTDTSFGILGDGFDGQMLGWPTPGGANLGLPVAPASAGPAVAVYGRLLADGPGSPGGFALRWVGSASASYRAESSVDLGGWQRGTNAPTHLGQGMFQWTDATIRSAPRFYRVVRE